MEFRRSGLLPVRPGPPTSPAIHGEVLRPEGVPEGVPREPCRDKDLGVEVLEARLLSANANCPASSMHLVR